MKKTTVINSEIAAADISNLMNKYKNTKTTLDGVEFASKKEAHRWGELRLLERAGEISDLQRQVKYELVPPQKRPSGGTERAVYYIADFVYTQNGNTVVEDVKGYRNPQSAGYAKFVIKRKLMLIRYGLEIKEV